MTGPNHASTIENHDAYDRPESPAALNNHLKPPSVLVGHEDTAVLRPDGKFSYECEFGVVIGTECRNVSRADASDVIAGYTCLNDMSNLAHPEESLWRKGYDNSAAIGPLVASPDEVPSDASMELRVNGVREQSAKRSELIFAEDVLIEEMSRYLTFKPGDVISTGSPADWGLLDDGDRVEVSIEGIGTLRHDVAMPDRDP